MAYLKSVRLFANLTDAELACFDQAIQDRSYAKGKILFLQNDPAHFFYLIRSGWIKLFRTMPEGDEVIVDMLTTGQTFGESAIFEQDCQMCSAEVVEDVSLLSIPARLFREQIRNNPKLAVNMLYVFCGRWHHHRRCAKQR